MEGSKYPHSHAAFVREMAPVRATMAGMTSGSVLTILNLHRTLGNVTKDRKAEDVLSRTAPPVPETESRALQDLSREGAGIECRWLVWRKN